MINDHRTMPNHGTSPNRGTPAWGTRRGPVVPYVPGLDGLRALAVLAVVVYHANPSWLGGGFLGVEVFFVISGYLITLLLIAERERTGTVSLGGFWLRRARRLLPALFTLLVGVVTYCALFDSERLGKLRGDVVAGVLYVSNWFQVWTGSSYTSGAEFAPLRHLWSLAVEEQFYIVWPLVMFVLLRRLRPRSLPVIGGLFTTASLAIAMWTAWMYRDGAIDSFSKTPGQYVTVFGRHLLRTDLLYLGTVPRATGLLLGAALATVWRPWAIRRGEAGRSAAGLDVVGVVGLVALGFMCWRFRDAVVIPNVGTTGYAALYRGGLLLVALATVATIATVTHPRSNLGRWLVGAPPLVWIGKRSYGLYLYHWVVFQAHRKSAGRALDLREFVVLMAVTLVVTELSYRFIETPVRTGTALAGFRRWRAHRGGIRGPLPVVVATLMVVPVFAFVQMAGARLVQDDVTANLDDNEGAVVTVPSSTVPAASSVPVPSSTAPVQRFDVLAVGDSVMLGSAKRLSSQGITVDAAKNRQVLEALQIFNYYKSVDKLGDQVVIHLGTNGTTRASTFDELLVPLAKVRQVFVLTVKVPGREYQNINNDIIRALPARYPNVTVLDWLSYARPHKDWFASDGIHPNLTGQVHYVDFIMQALGR